MGYIPYPPKDPRDAGPPGPPGLSFDFFPERLTPSELAGMIFALSKVRQFQISQVFLTTKQRSNYLLHPQFVALSHRKYHYMLDFGHHLGL